MKRCCRFGSRRGMAMAFAIMVMFVTSTIAGALAYYCTHTARIARFYLARTDARFAGQRTIENATQQVKATLDAMVQDAETMTGDFTGSALDLDKIVKKLNALNEAAAVKDAATGYEIKLAAAGQNDLKTNLETKGEAAVTITAIVRTSVGGISVDYALEQTLLFSTDKEAVLTTLPIYDYVYFANNYGRLNSSKIIANGDVGANADFTLNAATVNGYVRSAGTVSLYNDPKIWPYATYMAKIAAQTDDYYTQSRPTDPIRGTTNGIAYSVRWFGGYDPVVANNPHTLDVGKPDVVNPPGDKPKEVQEPTLRAEPVYVAPTPTPYPNQNAEPYVHPTKGKGDYKYPDEPEKIWDWGYYWYYKDRNGKEYWEKTNYWSQSAPSSMTNRYNADKAAIDAEWQAECDRRDDEYDAKCAEIDAANKKAVEDAQAAYQADLKQYTEVDVPAYNAALEKYNTYVSDLAAWTERDAAYSNYLAELEAYDQAYAKWVSESTAWENERVNGLVEETLTKQSYAESGVTNMIVKEHIEKVVWPEETSDAVKCEQYCRDYKLAVTNAVGSATNYVAGSLTCKNMQDGKSVSCTLSGKTRNVYYSTGKGLLYNKGVGFYTNYTDTATIKREVASVEITAGVCSSTFAPFKNDAVTGSGFDSAQARTLLAAVKDVEKGSVVLVGTQDNPIKINGPVFVNGDVVIRGLVSGRGTIYARRNIHIIGDVGYEHPPYWPHERADLNLPENSPAAVKRKNANKDLLSLVALGNIIVGDYTSTLWTNKTQMSFLNLSQQLPRLTVSDTDTTVGSKNRDYTALDGGQTVAFGYPDATTSRGNGYGADSWELSDGWPHKVSGMGGLYYYDLCHYNYLPRTRARRFYESVFGGETISQLKQTSVTPSSPSWNSSPTFWKRIAVKLGISEYNHDASAADWSQITNTDAGDVTEIDAILFAQHGIFGVVGGSVSKTFTLNGAMICRDEGLLTSFTNRFSNCSSARVWLNWDMRIKSGSAEGVRIGAVEDRQDSPSLSLRISDWREVGAP